MAQIHTITKGPGLFSRYPGLRLLSNDSKPNSDPDKDPDKNPIVKRLEQLNQNLTTMGHPTLREILSHLTPYMLQTLKSAIRCKKYYASGMWSSITQQPYYCELKDVILVIPAKPLNTSKLYLDKAHITSNGKTVQNKNKSLGTSFDLRDLSEC
jgi:hypothetical protein